MSTRKPTNLWVKITIDGKEKWVNTHHVRLIDQDYAGRAQFVYTSRHIITADQPLYKVMEALGYKMPPPPPVETHQTASLENHSGESEFVADAGLKSQPQ